MAQDKSKDSKAAPAAEAKKGKPVQKVLHDDDKVRVTETTFLPGDVGGSFVRGFRVVRYLQDGTQERTWADGKVEKIERIAGEVFVLGPDKHAFQDQNIGKTTMVIFAVTIKGVK